MSWAGRVDGAEMGCTISDVDGKRIKVWREHVNDMFNGLNFLEMS